MLTTFNDSLFTAINEFIEHRFDEWRTWRRHLHARPELSWREIGTTQYIRDKLAAMDLDLHPGPRDMGGFVDIDSGTPETRVAVRGDIDAIPVMQANDVPYASQFPGIMHACGHDVHTTVLLSICDTLQHLRTRDLLPVPVQVRAIFQPAEEVAQGAHETWKCGILNGVDAILAMHVDSSREVGSIGIRDGLQTAASDELEIVISGTGGHGARPHETADTVLAAAHLIQSAHALIPRIVDARDDTVLSFCKIVGGHSANVIPTEIEMLGTLRSFSQESRTRMLSRLEMLARSTEFAYDVKVRFAVTTSIPSVNNSPKLNQLVDGVARKMLGTDSVSIAERSLGGEDFACYQQHVPGTLIRIGSARGDQFNYYLHSPHFDVDERVIAVGCKLIVGSLIEWFAQAVATPEVS